MPYSLRESPETFDTDVRQRRHLYLRSDRLDADGLRSRVLGAAAPPWHDPGTSDRGEDGIWTWFRLERRADAAAPHAWAVLHVVDGGLKLTRAAPGGPDGPAGEFDRDTWNRVVVDLHGRLASALGDDDGVRLSLTDASAPFADWVGEEAVRALVRFARTADRSNAAGGSDDEERWLDFLHLALPNAKVGFADALRRVLLVNDWSEDAADELASQAELVEAYERLGRERYRRCA